MLEQFSDYVGQLMVEAQGNTTLDYTQFGSPIPPDLTQLLAETITDGITGDYQIEI